MKHGSNGIRKSFEQRSRATKRPPFPLEVVLSCESNLQFNLFLCWSVLNQEFFFYKIHLISAVARSTYLQQIEKVNRFLLNSFCDFYNSLESHPTNNATDLSSKISVRQMKKMIWVLLQFTATSTFK